MRNQIQSDRWFGTPVGAALLVGALGGGLITATFAFGSVVVQWTRYGIWVSFIYQGVCTTAYLTLLCAAPAICLRDGRKVLGGLLAGVVASGITFALSWVWHFSMMSGITILGVCVYYLMGASQAAVLGYATALLYAVREVRWRCMLIAAFCGLLVAGIWSAYHSITSTGNPFSASGLPEVAFTLRILCSVLLVLPPALIVERHMKRMHAKEKGTAAKVE